MKKIRMKMTDNTVVPKKKKKIKFISIGQKFKITKLSTASY